MIFVRVCQFEKDIILENDYYLIETSLNRINPSPFFSLLRSSSKQSCSLSELLLASLFFFLRFLFLLLLFLNLFRKLATLISLHNLGLEKVLRTSHTDLVHIHIGQLATLTDVDVDEVGVG